MSLSRPVLCVLLVVCLVLHPAALTESESVPPHTRARGSAGTVLLVSAVEGQRGVLETHIRRLGGTVLAEYGSHWLDAVVPPSRVQELLASDLVGSHILPHPTHLTRSEAMPSETPVSYPEDVGRNIAEEVHRSIGADELAAQGFSGRDIVVAVVDTGIAPGHLSLRNTTSGAPKIIDWVDFTGQGEAEQRARSDIGTTPAEGDVYTSYSALPASGNIMTSAGRISVQGIPSKSGLYRYGFVRRDRFGLSSPDSGERLVVVVTDPRQAGEYERVYIDSDGDLELSDETPLEQFQDTGSVGWVGPPGQAESVSVVVTELPPEGRMVNLGFDGNGHGTHVAGALGANGVQLKGVAPGVQLMALKALRKSGEGSWDDIARAMLYAAEQGADIINVSIGGVSRLKDSLQAENELIRELTETYGVLVVIATGNNGPGLGSISTPGNANYSLTVGGYMTPSLWRLAYNYDIAQPGLWYYSAVGPRNDGSAGPNLIAPGIGYSTVPYAADADGYGVMEGTSMAVPYVAGGAALLWEAARLNGSEPGPLQLKSALELGARPIGTYHFVEQGYGRQRLSNSLEALLQALATRKRSPGALEVVVDAFDEVKKGVHSRSGDIGSTQLLLENTSSRKLLLEVVEDPDNHVRPQFASLLVPSRSRRRLQLNYEPYYAPGLHEIMVKADDQRTFGTDLSVLHTLVTPQSIASRNGTLSFSGELRANERKRYFIKVPPGSYSLQFEGTMPGEQEKAGRMRVHVIGPRGVSWSESGLVGRGTGKALWKKTFRHPEPGVWEVVVHAPPDLRMYQLRRTEFNVGVVLQGIVPSPESQCLRAGAGGVQVSGYSQLAGYGNVQSGYFSATRLVPARPEQKVSAPVVTEHIEFSSAQPYTDEFELTSAARFLELSVENRVGRGRPKLTLYRYDEQAAPVEVEVSTEPTPSGEVRLLKKELPPGRYLAWVEAQGSRHGMAQYRRVVVEQHSPLEFDPADFVAAPDFELGVSYQLKVPEVRGGYSAHGVLHDEEGDKVITTFPIHVAVGDPDVILQTRPVQTPTLLDELSLQVVTLERGSFEPITVPVRVNGRSYSGHDGLVTIPIDKDAVEVTVEFRDPKLGWLSRKVRVRQTEVNVVGEESVESTGDDGRREKLEFLLQNSGN